jgi:hypothetical protein
MKAKQNYIRYTGILLTAMVFSMSAWGQQSEVRVVKPYTPTLSDAEKIQLLPNLEEEIPFTPPQFTYQLYPKRYESEFKVVPIKSARMVKPALNRLYKSELTLGFGNYLTPLAELNINQLRSRNGTFGLALRHHSMNGKMKLNDNLKVPAGFSESNLKVYGDRFIKKSVFDYKVGTGYNTYVQYGVDTTEVTEEIDRDSLKQAYFLAEASIGLHSAHADSFHFNYNVGLDYYYFTHQFTETEHGARLNFDFSKRLRVLDIAGDVGGAFYGHSPDWDQTIGNYTMVWINPYIAKSEADWRFTAGFNTYMSFASDSSAGDIQPFHFYPKASFEFNVVNEVIVPYFGVDGFLESNNYRKIVEENPYVVPTLSVKPTSHKLIAYAGIKGRVTGAFTYNLKGSYSIIDNQYFFVNDTSQVLKNQFSVVYSDITLLKLHGEISVRPSDSWKIFLKANYYNYALSTMKMADGTSRNLRDDDHAWNKPTFDVSLQARYNMGDKIIVTMGIYTIGKRYYEDFIWQDDGSEPTLPLDVDANLGIEYRFTKMLSFWARLNNIAAQRYYLYNQYPSFRFRGMVGFTYAL